MRTHFCGLVDEALVGQTVTLCGWADVARNLGGLCFIDLRDHEGIVQVVAEPDAEAAGNADVIAAAAHVGYEDCLRVTGVVRKRQSVNDKLRTGQVEIVATKIDKLSRADRTRNLRELERIFGKPALPVSAERGEGLETLWTTIARLGRGADRKGKAETEGTTT